MNPNVSIIFPIFNQFPQTKNCLASIKKIHLPGKIEIIIINNHSRQNPRGKIRRFCKKLHLQLIFIDNPQNLGFARAVNQGIKKARYPFLLITNNDLLFHPDYLNILLRAFLKNPQAGAVGGQIRSLKNKQTILFSGVRFSKTTGILSHLKPQPKTHCTDWLPGCNLFLKKSLFKKIGLFDPQFFFYFEDADLCTRLRQANFKVLCVPQALIYHHEGKTINQQPFKKQLYWYQGKFTYLKKHARLWQLATSLTLQFALFLPAKILRGQLNSLAAFPAFAKTFFPKK